MQQDHRLEGRGEAHQKYVVEIHLQVYIENPFECPLEWLEQEHEVREDQTHYVAVSGAVHGGI